jgi:hypothetical protein
MRLHCPESEHCPRLCNTLHLFRPLLAGADLIGALAAALGAVAIGADHIIGTDTTMGADTGAALIGIAGGAPVFESAGGRQPLGTAPGEPLGAVSVASIGSVGAFLPASAVA